MRNDPSFYPPAQRRLPCEPIHVCACKKELIRHPVKAKKIAL